MFSFRDATFAVTDVETTGSNAKKNRIIEIACVKVRGDEIISKYSSLVNPHQFIPPFVSNMTGISNKMAFTAREPDEVFAEVRQVINDDDIFTAHNAPFDWGFVQQSLKRNKQKQLQTPVLCTLTLARKLLPNNKKKNVGALAEYFGIIVKNRHRALGDAEATAKILIELINIAYSSHGIESVDELIKFQNKKINFFNTDKSSINRVSNLLNDIPYAPGVIYFKDEEENIIYLKKAVNLNFEANHFFQSKTSGSKLNELISKVHNLDWEETENEIEASILESREIMDLKPQYNFINDIYEQLPNDSYTQNLILIAPDEDDNNYINFYLIKNGGLLDTISIGRKQKLKQLKLKIFHHYYNGLSPISNLPDIYERITISKWINTNKHDGLLLDLDIFSYEECINEIENFINNQK